MKKMLSSFLSVVFLLLTFAIPSQPVYAQTAPLLEYYQVHALDEQENSLESFYGAPVTKTHTVPNSTAFISLDIFTPATQENDIELVVDGAVCAVGDIVLFEKDSLALEIICANATTGAEESFTLTFIRDNPSSDMDIAGLYYAASDENEEYLSENEYVISFPERVLPVSVHPRTTYIDIWLELSAKSSSYIIKDATGAETQKRIVLQGTSSTVTIEVTAESGDIQLYTITFSKSEYIEVTGIRLGKKVVTLKPDSEPFRLTATVLPENATDNIIDFSSNDESIATIDAEGFISPHSIGCAVITATTRMGAFTAECIVNVAVPPQNVVVNSMPSPLVLSPGTKGTLTANVEPAEADQIVTWESENDSVATVTSMADNIAEVEGVAPGKTTIYATSADGSVTGYCQVTVERQNSSIILSRSRLVLLDGAPDMLNATLSTPDAKLRYSLKDAKTYTEVQFAEKLVCDDTTPAVDGVRTVAFTPVSGSEGNYILRMEYDDAAHGNAWAECRIDIATIQPGTTPDYPAYLLDPAAVTVSKKQSLNATAAQFGLWPNADAGTPVSLMAAGVKVQFKGGDSNPNNNFFDFKASDENTVDVQIKSTTGISKKYQDDVEIVLPNDDAISVEGKLTINVNDKAPALKASVVTVNVFYDDRTAKLDITGGEVMQVQEASNNKLSWARLVPAATPTDIKVSVDDIPSKAGGTLKLEAKLIGWEGWYPVNVKVSRVYTPPTLKLANSKVSLYMSTTRSMDNVLTLQPKKSGETLGGLGVTGVTVDLAKAGAFNVKDYSFNVQTGKFIVQADRTRAERELRGTLPLLVSVEGASKYKVKLNASVSLVKSDAAIKLKASKATVTLNPNLATGERYNVLLSTNIAGFDLSSWHDQNPLQVLVYDSKDKAKVKTDLNGQKGKITAKISEDGSTLMVSVGKGADFNKTYKVLLTLPSVNTKKGALVPATLTLTIKTTKESTSTIPTAKSYFGPKATISIKGKMDISTGTRATITAKISNYNGGIDGIPEFVITPPQSVSTSAWDSTHAEYSNFRFRRLSDKSWTVELAENGKLIPGSYKIAIKNGDINDADTVSTKAVKLTISAAKPKVTLSTKKVTLYNNDPGSRGIVTLTIPASYADIQDVTLKGAKLANGSPNPDYAYTIRQLDSNTYAIMLDQSKTTTVLNSVKKSASVTLEVWLEGNNNAKPVTTTKLTVAVK
ncbi:Ig-like domain-containing protein [Ruminococcaceae bacterium OttesenSCG-928-D13]|nr:Ig-like domain-containing protein [Ruminococcaceae bacterium OttesenSCG-928-D13]MDL2327792.1 Ig-like domain-containing protein [Ruminococcaceae bacterium OttesenSCG-928-A11]